MLLLGVARSGPTCLGCYHLVGNLTNNKAPHLQRNFLTNEDGGVGYKPDAGSHMDNILGQLCVTEAAAMDGKMSDALRLILFGEEFQEDLCARNIFRAREMEMPTYAGIASCFGVTPDTTV